MKKILIYSSIVLAAGLVSCNDFLDKNPLDTFANTPEYWNNPDNVEYQTNALYNNYSGYGNGSGGGWYYFKSLSDDQANREFDNWTFINVPASSSTYYSSPFESIRQCNYIIENVRTSSLSDTDKRYYEGVARMNRAWLYYQLVREYGDIQWVNTPIDPADRETLYKGRDDRDIVMDSVLNDLNYACATVTGSSHNFWNKDLPYAMKSDITLFEGTYCKYRTQNDNGKAADSSRATRYLQECVSASQHVMDAGYTLSSSYKANYNSLNLSSNTEMIFYKQYEKTYFMHSTIDYTCSSSEQYGMTRDAFDNYLFLDGKPLATTTLDTNDAAVLNTDGNLDLTAVLAVRDKRLNATIDSIVCVNGYGWARSGGAPMTSSTGYTVGKYDNLTMTVDDRQNINKNYTDAPLFWLSVVYLNFAEAKAELGTFTDTDFNNSIKGLYDRAGLSLTLADLTAMNDPVNDMNVSSLIWEIRRCRRCELMFDNWVRYWDLIRWHQLDKLDSSNNPKILQGANMTNADQSKVSLSYASGTYYIDASYGQTRTYASKYYFYPIPSGQITLNPNLTQNPGW